jgi:hypothetical protein
MIILLRDDGGVPARAGSMSGEAGTEDLETVDARERGPRIGRVVVGYSVFLTALIPFFLWVGRGEWFQHDDWDYLVSRKAGDLGDLLRPHNAHWETIPVLVYRMLWSLFGLRYRPYQLVSIVLSLVGVALLLVVMLRARTRPWIAMLTATLLVLFGDAQANVALRVTGITFVGFAVPLGLVQLLLADHDGPRDRRDWLGLCAGLAALLCSSVAIAMLFVVGVVVFVKRGWRLAIFHVLPPALVFAVWFATTGHTDRGAGNPARLRPLPQALHFAWFVLNGTFESLTRMHGLGGVLVGVVVIGIVFALRHAGPERRRQAVVPCAMVLGAGAFAIETGLGRAHLLDQGARAVPAGHYMDVAAYLALPAIAFVAEELVRRWRLVAPALVAVLVLLITLNARVLVDREHLRSSRVSSLRNTILLIPRLPLAKQVPRSVRPYNGIASPITVGWLLDSAREGKLPKRRYVAAGSLAVAKLRISLVLAGSGATPCRAFRGAAVRHLKTGATVRFRGAAIRVSYVSSGKAVGEVEYPTPPGSEWGLVNVGPPLTVRFEVVASKRSAPMVCT